MVCLSCMANNTAVTDPSLAADCRMTTRPSLLLTELHMLTYFCAGVVMSSWVWQKSTVKAWKHHLKRFAFFMLIVDIKSYFSKLSHGLF